MEDNMPTKGRVLISAILVAIAYFGFEAAEQYKPTRMRTVDLTIAKGSQIITLRCARMAVRVGDDGCIRQKPKNSPTTVGLASNRDGGKR